MSDPPDRRPDRRPLTDRQLEVVGFVARGHPNKEIAARLGISTRGVEAVLTRVYEKLGVANRSALIAVALSEAGFGLAVAQRPSPPSPVGALGVPQSLEDEARAYEHAPFMVAVTRGLEHRYTFVNRPAAEVAGRPVERLVGRTVREAYPDLDPQFGGALDACYRSGRPWSTGLPAKVRWVHGGWLGARQCGQPDLPAGARRGRRGRRSAPYRRRGG